MIAALIAIGFLMLVIFEVFIIQLAMKGESIPLDLILLTSLIVAIIFAMALYKREISLFLYNILASLSVAMFLYGAGVLIGYVVYAPQQLLDWKPLIAGAMLIVGIVLYIVVRRIQWPFSSSKSIV